MYCDLIKPDSLSYLKNLNRQVRFLKDSLLEMGQKTGIGATLIFIFFFILLNIEVSQTKAYRFISYKCVKSQHL